MLRYPHARLALVNRLSSTNDCLEAFIETAKEYGLTCPVELSEVKEQIARGTCSSLAAAGKVLSLTLPSSYEQVWPQLQERIKEFHKARLQDGCQGIGLQTSTSKCDGMAPVVLDLLLQTVQAHL